MKRRGVLLALDIAFGDGDIRAVLLADLHGGIKAGIWADSGLGRRRRFRWTRGGEGFGEGASEHAFELEFQVLEVGLGGDEIAAGSGGLGLGGGDIEDGHGADFHPQR